MDQLTRRGLLETTSNPDRRLDYISALSGEFLLAATEIHHRVRLRYVPATLILDPVSWFEYLSQLTKMSWPSMEELASTMIADANDQLVPRWIEVSISSVGEETEQQVIIDDRQPGWNNENILARLDSF